MWVRATLVFAASLASACSAKARPAGFFVVRRPSMEVPRRSPLPCNLTGNFVSAPNYQEGTAAYLQRDFAVAARSFEEAYDSTSSPLALRAAMQAHDQAGEPDHLARAATLAMVLAALPGSTPWMELAVRTERRLAPRLARVTLLCQECCLRIDDVSQAGFRGYVTPGRHRVRATSGDGRTIERSMEFREGTDQLLDLQPQ